MALIKFRNHITRNFEFYTEISDDDIKRISALITPSHYASQICFYIENPSVRVLPPHVTIAPPSIILNASWPFYYIEGGMIFMSDPYSPIGTIVTENIKTYRDGYGNWHQVTDIWVGNYGVVSIKEMAFTPLSNDHFSNFILDQSEIETLKLVKKNPEEYFDKIRVREWLMI